MNVEDTFDALENRLLRFAAQVGSSRASSQELDLIVEQLLQNGFFCDEFVYLEDQELNFEEKRPQLHSFLGKLGWRELNEEEEFLFLTGFYAQIGKGDDITAYYAICRWMEDVGWWLGNSYSIHFVADRIGAQRIYGSYFSPCKYNGWDFIPGVTDPRKENWDQLGDFRPTVVFSEWLDQNPDFMEKYQPLRLDLLSQLR